MHAAAKQEEPHNKDAVTRIFTYVAYQSRGLVISH
jgi:hypothetical protein